MQLFATRLTSAIFLASVSVSHANMAFPSDQFYAAIQGGIFQGQFDSRYVDQTDIIPQNISTTLTQNGYTGGLAIGYTHLVNARYFANIELAGNLDGNSALYQSGAANTAFSDKIELKYHFDLTVAPGIITHSDFSPYLKLGISYASVQDNLTSPVGYDPIMMQYNTHKNKWGFVGGLGVRYSITPRVKLFAEANYHDYGTINLSAFENFSATYSHSAHLYSYGAAMGVTYIFNA